MTRRCNARCDFCQAPIRKRAELSVQDISEISRALRSVGVESLKLSGGEPTVRDDLPQIIEVVSEAQLKPVVITNGMYLPRTVLIALADAGGEVKFSVHYPDSRNDRVLDAASFCTILDNMRACRRHGLTFAINSVVTATTANTMHELVEFAGVVGARKISFVPVVPRGRAASKGRRLTLTHASLDSVRSEITKIAASHDGPLDIRCIDLRRQDYWIVEDDGTLWIERERESLDTLVMSLGELRRLGNDD